MSAHPLTRRQLLRSGAALGAAAGLGVVPVARAARAQQPGPPLSPTERQAIDEGLGKAGTWIEEQAVYTVGLPRNDLSVTIQGEPIPIPFGFGGWVSFKKTQDGRMTVLMSDTVLLEREVNPVISAAHEHGLEVSAIHNHFFYEQPRIFYMHLHAMGEAGDLARRYSEAIRPAPLHPANQPAAPPPPPRTADQIFDLPALDRIVGYTGAVLGPVYKYTIGRADLTITAMGAEMTANMGLNSWASFAGTAERAHVAGDVAMLAPEVNPVIASLRRSGLEVVALHNHMLDDEPRIFFLHYYGTGPAPELARAFRAALDELGRPPRGHGHGRGRSG